MVAEFIYSPPLTDKDIETFMKPAKHIRLTKGESMKHLMVDIESLGTGDDAAVISIGACMFSMRGEIGSCFLQAINLKDACQHGNIDADTIGWWIQQPEAAWSHLFKDPVTSHEAASNFIALIETEKPEFIWANPPQFDIVILRSLFDDLGYKWPMHYTSERDVRTIKALYNGAIPEKITNMEKHNPLADSRFQAQLVAHCWQWIRGRQ